MAGMAGGPQPEQSAGCCVCLRRVLVSQAPGRDDGQVGARGLAAEARGQAEEAAVQRDRGAAVGLGDSSPGY